MNRTQRPRGWIVTAIRRFALLAVVTWTAAALLNLLAGEPVRAVGAAGIALVFAMVWAHYRPAAPRRWSR